MGQPLLGSIEQQPVAPDTHLTTLLAAPSTEMVLEPNLGIPMVGLEKKKRAARPQKKMNGAEIFGVQVMAQDGAHHIVEAARGQVAS